MWRPILTFGGQVLDSSGVYVDTLVSATGCDSILTLTLTMVHPTDDVTIDADTFGGQVLDSSVYVDTLVSAGVTAY